MRILQHILVLGLGCLFSLLVYRLGHFYASHFSSTTAGKHLQLLQHSHTAQYNHLNHKGKLTHQSRHFLDEQANRSETAPDSHDSSKGTYVTDGSRGDNNHNNDNPAPVSHSQKVETSNISQKLDLIPNVETDNVPSADKTDTDPDSTPRTTLNQDNPHNSNLSLGTDQGANEPSSKSSNSSTETIKTGNSIKIESTTTALTSPPSNLEGDEITSVTIHTDELSSDPIASAINDKASSELISSDNSDSGTESSAAGASSSDEVSSETATTGAGGYGSNTDNVHTTLTPAHSTHQVGSTTTDDNSNDEIDHMDEIDLNSPHLINRRYHPSTSSNPSNFRTTGQYRLLDALAKFTIDNYHIDMYENYHNPPKSFFSSITTAFSNFFTLSQGLKPNDRVRVKRSTCINGRFGDGPLGSLQNLLKSGQNIPENVNINSKGGTTLQQILNQSSAGSTKTPTILNLEALKALVERQNGEEEIQSGMKIDPVLATQQDQNMDTLANFIKNQNRPSPINLSQPRNGKSSGNKSTSSNNKASGNHDSSSELTAAGDGPLLSSLTTTALTIYTLLLTEVKRQQSQLILPQFLTNNNVNQGGISSRKQTTLNQQQHNQKNKHKHTLASTIQDNLTQTQFKTVQLNNKISNVVKQTTVAHESKNGTISITLNKSLTPAQITSDSTPSLAPKIMSNTPLAEASLPPSTANTKSTQKEQDHDNDPLIVTEEPSPPPLASQPQVPPQYTPSLLSDTDQALLELLISDIQPQHNNFVLQSFSATCLGLFSLAVVQAFTILYILKGMNAFSSLSGSSTQRPTSINNGWEFVMPTKPTWMKKTTTTQSVMENGQDGRENGPSGSGGENSNNNSNLNNNQHQSHLDETPSLSLLHLPLGESNHGLINAVNLIGITSDNCKANGDNIDPNTDLPINTNTIKTTNTTGINIEPHDIHIKNLDNQSTNRQSPTPGNIPQTVTTATATTTAATTTHTAFNPTDHYITNHYNSPTIITTTTTSHNNNNNHNHNNNCSNTLSVISDSDTITSQDLFSLLPVAKTPIHQAIATFNSMGSPTGLHGLNGLSNSLKNHFSSDLQQSIPSLTLPGTGGNEPNGLVTGITSRFAIATGPIMSSIQSIQNATTPIMASISTPIIASMTTIGNVTTPIMKTMVQNVTAMQNMIFAQGRMFQGSSGGTGGMNRVGLWNENSDSSNSQDYAPSNDLSGGSYLPQLPGLHEEIDGGIGQSQQQLQQLLSIKQHSQQEYKHLQQGQFTPSLSLSPFAPLSPSSDISTNTILSTLQRSNPLNSPNTLLTTNNSKHHNNNTSSPHHNHSSILLYSSHTPNPLHLSPPFCS